MTDTPEQHPQHPRPDVAHGALVLAIALFALFLILGSSIGLLTETDRALARWIIVPRNELIIAIALAFDWVGGGVPAVILVAAITIAILATRRWKAAAYFAATSIVSTALVDLFKNAYARPRPPDGLIEAGFGSYPSGHSARAAVIVVALCIILPRLWSWVTGTVIIVAMMASRVLLEVHWPTDTIGGALLGASVGISLWALIARRSTRHGGPEAGLTRQ